MQISEGYAAIHGFPEGTTEIARSECLAGVHPDDIGRVEQSRSEAFRERRREYNVEYRIIRPGGELRWVETRCFISYNGEGRPHRVVGVSIDITERKRAEDRLQESERKLRDLLGALPAAIYVTDAAGHITYCNQSAVDLWGSEPKLGRDKWSDLVKFHHADGSPMALADCPTEVALKQGRIVRGQEAIIERKDGTRIPIIPYPTPLRDETGTIVGVVNMTVDISERKKAELTLADHNMQLALAGKAALVGNFAYDVDTECMQISEGYAAIHGFPDGTTEIARSEWQARRASRGPRTIGRDPQPRLSASGWPNIVWSIASFGQRATFGGSRRAALFRTTAMAARSGSWASTLMSPSVNERRNITQR